VAARKPPAPEASIAQTIAVPTAVDLFRVFLQFLMEDPQSLNQARLLSPEASKTNSMIPL
jgi:hypothetical protein